MKIAFISTLYPPEVMGGAEIVVEKITNELIKRGHKVTIITLNRRKHRIETRDNTKIYRVPLNLYFPSESPSQNITKKIAWHLIDLFNIKAYLEIKKILKDEAPDLVHIHNYMGLSPLSFKVVKDLNMPLVFTAHDYSPICVRTSLLNRKGQICEDKNLPCKFYNWIQKIIIDSKPDVVMAPSRFLLQKLESEGLFQDTEKRVLPNPIDIKNKRGKKDYDTIDILFVGGLSKHKGPDTLIKSFKKVKGDNLRLHIVGRGPCFEKLEKIARNDSRIIFHGFLRGEKLMDMYRMANVTVVPSILYDNSPMVVYESFMCSTPVVASRIGGIPELVKHGYNGFLFEPGDNTELAKILNMVSRDPEILKKLEIGAYKSSKKYDIEKHIDKLEEIYRSLT